MKHISILGFLFLLNTHAFCQHMDVSPKNDAITIGILQGGGSLVGIDFEKMLTNHFSFQVGLGLVGFGAGINYHFKESIRSSFISLQYWNQGTGRTFAQNAIGPCYVYRAKKLFTCQLGFAKTLSKGPAWPKNRAQPDFMFTYAIGVYLPL